MANLTFWRLREVNRVRCEAVFHPLDAWSPTDWMTAIAGEIGEAANMIKKMRRGEDISVEEVGKELADAVIYLDLLAARLGLDLGACVAQKFDEVSDRRRWRGPRLTRPQPEDDDHRRLDSAPTITDMDIEAAAILEEPDHA